MSRSTMTRTVIMKSGSVVALEVDRSSEMHKAMSTLLSIASVTSVIVNHSDGRTSLFTLDTPGRTF